MTGRRPFKLSRKRGSRFKPLPPLLALVARLNELLPSNETLLATPPIGFRPGPIPYRTE